MDKSRVKNFIILLLALVNIFLLFIVASDLGKAAEAERYKTTSVRNVFSDNGIAISQTVDLLSEAPEALYLRRDATAEKYRVARLIGDCNTVDLGGNIYRYDGSDGVATFRGTGEFEIAFNDAAYPGGKDFVKTSRDALETLGVEYAKSEEPTVASVGGDTVVTLICAYEGVPVFNAQAVFTYSSGCLRLISGRRPLDTSYSTGSHQDTEDCITALMNYLYYARYGSGDICTEITDLSPGYSVQTAVSGDCSLNPVWCITSDTGRYYVDGFTGKIEKL